jgi:hypothetical protein
MRKHLLGMCCISLTFSSCGGNFRDDVTDILGPYTATGTIVGTGSSLVRRGTHVLTMNGRSRFYLESRSVNLTQFKDTTVVIKGEVSPNSHPQFLPVFQVSSVTPLEPSMPTDLQHYTVSTLSLQLDAPREWKSALKGGRLTFAIPEEDGAFIAIENDDRSPLPEEGLHVRIDGRNGTRVIDEVTGVHRVYVRLTPNRVLLFTFGPKGEESLLLRDAFYTMLQSVQFSNLEQPSITGDPEKLQGSGQPCGGPAGVLCPEGEYCAVREFDTGIGGCRKL